MISQNFYSLDDHQALYGLFVAKISQLKASMLFNSRLPYVAARELQHAIIHFVQARNCYQNDRVRQLRCAIEHLNTGILDRYRLLLFSSDNYKRLTACNASHRKLVKARFYEFEAHATDYTETTVKRYKDLCEEHRLIPYFHHKVTKSKTVLPVSIRQISRNFAALVCEWAQLELIYSALQGEHEVIFLERLIDAFFAKSLEEAEKILADTVDLLKLAIIKIMLTNENHAAVKEFTSSMASNGFTAEEEVLPRPAAAGSVDYSKVNRYFQMVLNFFELNMWRYEV